MWNLANNVLSSRLLLGTAQYPSLEVMREAIIASNTNIVTVSVKRQLSGASTTNGFWELIKELNCHVLPNTAGCRQAHEAITIAEMSREIFETHWIKLEVIGD